MYAHSSNSADTVCDPLSEMLRGLRLDGVEYQRSQMTGSWATAFPRSGAARFHFVGDRGCWMRMPDGDWIQLGAGDAILLPRGADHVLASTPDAPILPIKSCAVRPICDAVSELEGGCEGPRTLMFSGRMHFNVDAMHPLLRMMPEVMRANELAASEPSIPHLLEAMAREVAETRIGGGGILARLADVLAANIIRTWVECGCGSSTGWIAAVRSPDIGGVLAAIHRDPGRNWTVPDLAQAMGASRSRFAERFAAVVGETPAQYVAQVRMHQARQWLTRDRMKVALVARRLGYESDAAFSRAFKRVFGLAPGQARSAASEPTTDPA